MSEKKHMTTWVPTVVMGVVAILFSVYALQEQTDLHKAKEEMDGLRAALTTCQKQLEEQKAIATDAEIKMNEALKMAKAALVEAETQYRRASKK